MNVRSAAFSLALFLGIAVSGAAYAVPVVSPVDSIREALSGTSALEEARWVKRCRVAKVRRGGRLVNVTRCRNVWVGRRR